jgi:hypothetical protein
MKGEPILESGHIARLCKRTSLGEDGKIDGIAFRIRPRNGISEPYLSVNWLEYFPEFNRIGQISKIWEILRYKLEFKKNAILAVLNVGETRVYVRAKSPDRREILILHEPEANDPSHCGIHNITLEDDIIADLIAQKVQETYPAN